MFIAQKNFLPTQQTIVARRRCGSTIAETIVPSPPGSIGDNDSGAPANPSLNETITIFGADGTAEFIGSGFRFQAAGRR
jgi:hypothetical protein